MIDCKQISYIKVGGEVNKLIISNNLYQIKNMDLKSFVAIGNTSKIFFCFEKSNISLLQFTYNKIAFFKDEYFIFSGAKLNEVYRVLSQYQITGFEKISTIPGWIGGAIAMNASYDNQSISDNLKWVLVYLNNEFIKVPNYGVFSYRNSLFNGENILIVGAMFKIEKISKEKQIKMYQNAFERRAKLGVSYQENLGSTFLNIKSISIGLILDELGCKKIELFYPLFIDENHANFIKIKKNSKILLFYHFINYLKCVIYNYLQTFVELEINILKSDGRKYR